MVWSMAIGGQSYSFHTIDWWIRKQRPSQSLAIPIKVCSYQPTLLWRPSVSPWRPSVSKFVWPVKAVSPDGDLMLNHVSAIVSLWGTFRFQTVTPHPKLGGLPQTQAVCDKCALYQSLGSCLSKSIVKAGFCICPSWLFLDFIWF